MALHRLVYIIFAGLLATSSAHAAGHPRRKPAQASQQAPEVSPKPAVAPGHEAQVIITTDAQRSYSVTVRTKSGKYACPGSVNRLAPCVLKVPPGPATVMFKKGSSTPVNLPEGPTQLSFTKDRWTLTLPGVILMSAGLVLEIVGASASSNALTATGLIVMGVGAATLIVGIAIPRDVVEVKHDDFLNVTRAVQQPLETHPVGATLSLQF